MEPINELERFIEWVEDIVREFYYIHEHFLFETDRHIKDFEDAFSRWHHDIFNKYEHIVVNMEWMSALNTLEQKQLLLIISFHGLSFFRLKYRVGDKIHERFNHTIKALHNGIKNLASLCGGFSFRPRARTDEFRQYFESRKNKFMQNDPEIILDTEWANNQDLIENNTLFLIASFRDEYMLKQIFSNDLFGKKEIQEKVDLE